MRVRIRTFNVIRSFIFSFEIPSKTLISFFEEIQLYFDRSYDGISMFQIPKNPVTYVITSHSFIHLQPIIILFIIIIINHIIITHYNEPCHQQPTSCYTTILCNQILLVTPVWLLSWHQLRCFSV